jgi:mono/diheme cytochrome c family protein
VKNPWLRRGLLVVVGLVALAAAAVAIGLALGERRMNRQIDVVVQAVPIPIDAQAIERGRYLYASRGCAECHGADGAGRRFVDAGGVRLAGPAIARGSVTQSYQPADWVRAVRHGVKPDGRPLRVMPSEDFNRLTDADMGALVAYVHSLAPVAARPGEFTLPLPARVLYGYGALPEAAEKIDHRLAPQQPVPEGVTLEHGMYVANMCFGCHGTGLQGGKVPGAPPDWPAAARLTAGPGNVMADRYADAQAFVAMMRSGKRPDGSTVAVMPFETLRTFSDTDTRALHLYLRSLAAPR